MIAAGHTGGRATPWGMPVFEPVGSGKVCQLHDFHGLP